MTSDLRRLPAVLGLAFLAALSSTPTFAAATITILNNDGAGEGFNDPTPAAPVGGNPGTTLGQQRLIVFQEAASIWGATLTSTVTIVVRANFDPLNCNATSAVLGSAGPITVSRDFTGNLNAGHWYHAALASKLFGSDLVPTEPDIVARFNSNLGQVGCFTGTFFYLGLDNNHGPSVDLLAVVLHELGHGLGFSTTTNGTTGSFLAGLPSAYDAFTLDTSTGKLWDDPTVTNADRVASAINSRRVVWTGANAVADVPSVLQQGTPEMVVTGPASVADTYLVGPASFGPPFTSSGVGGELAQVVAQASGPGCSAFTSANAVAVLGKIALIDRGTCTFTVKVKNAQNAGAIGVLIADNVAGSPPPGLAGADPTIFIPSGRITQADGNRLKLELRFRSRRNSGIFVNLALNLSVRAGADALGRPLLYTPNPFQGGSSVSHWDTIAFPNLLMEPSINPDLTHSVVAPFDLTFPMLRDLGW